MTTKQYLRFSSGSVFGVIGSSTAKILQIDAQNDKMELVAVASCENVIIWNLKTKEKHQVLYGGKVSVTCLIDDPSGKYLAVGYADGTVRIFDYRTGSSTITFSGHKSAVSCLACNEGGFVLSSGGKDSEIVVWDILEQSGMFRLKGHKGSITKCHFFKQRNVLISSSKDTFIKFWDLDTQHCFQTLIGNRNEVLDFIIISDTRLITGINGPDLKVWDLFITNEDIEDKESSKKPRLDVSTENIESDDSNDIIKYSEAGRILTVGDKTVCLCVDQSERLLGCHASTKVLQLYKILNAEEVSKKFRKRRKKENKLREKIESTNENDTVENKEITVSLSDQFQNFKPIYAEGKIQSFCTSVNNKGIAKIFVLLKNNSISMYLLDTNDKNNEATLTRNISLDGHRTVVKTLSYSTDSATILSASEESVKIWRTYNEEEKCTHTIPCDFALCSIFVTGNSHCIIGTKSGVLQIFEINRMELLEKVNSHDGAVNCICVSPDECGFATGSKDKDVKFWNFELIKDENYSDSKKRLTVKHTRTLKMNDEVLCIKYSPDKNKFAVSLLDNTVQVLFSDTLKLAFSLYGHVLPVTCLDMSYDSTLIATGSEDKDIRIWSMEFGSCNKFLKKAHDKGITCLRFLPKTHMFFTAGRDAVVKQWDADNFQKIITLKGHQSDVTALVISPDGRTVATASQDKSLRLWEKTSEPLVLEEEQELEREEAEEANVDDLPVIPGEVNKEVGLAGLKTTETIKSVDHLMEAIDIYKEETLKLEDHERECKSAGKNLPPPPPHPLLTAYLSNSPIHFMLKIMRKMKSSELEGTLLYLPFHYVMDFLQILCEFADRGWAVELSERSVSFLLRTHLGQISSTSTFEPIIRRLKESLLGRVYQMRNDIGFCLSATHTLQRVIEAQEEVSLFMGVLQGLQQKKKRSRKKLERHIVTF